MQDLNTFSAELRKKSFISALSIGSFVLIYSLMVLATFAFIIFSGYWCIQLVILYPRWFTIAITLSVGSIGLVVLKYLFRFVNREKQEVKGVKIEITEHDQPEFFAFLKELTKRVGTRMPKRVYVNPDVNAGVRFSSNFWSLLWPGSKELQIGWGLVNGINASELKFILAHEFGHFSQGSMMLSSYTYQVNTILGHLLLEPEERRHDPNEENNGTFTTSINLGKEIVNGMESILRGIFRLVNRSFSSLSRQMEFHADAVAAQIYGPAPQKYSLSRGPFIENSLNLCFDFYNSGVGKQYRSANIFANHRKTQQVLLKEHHIPNTQGWAEIDSDYGLQAPPSRIELSENWSSHPEVEERVASVNRFFKAEDFPELDYQPATSLFHNTLKLEEELTEAILNYEGAQPPSEVLSDDNFDLYFEDYFRDHRFPEVFQHYYNDWSPLKVDLENSAQIEKIAFETLFNDWASLEILKLHSLENDLFLLQQIAGKGTGIKSFRYLGRKCKILDSGRLSAELRKEIEALKTSIFKHDQKIYNYFLALAKEKGQDASLKQCYKDWLAYQDPDAPNSKLSALKYMEGLSFTSENTSYDLIKSRFEKLLPTDKSFRRDLQELKAEESLWNSLNEEAQKVINDFLKQEARYFDGTAYIEDRLQSLIGALQVYAHLILPQKSNRQKLKTLNLMASLLPEELILEAARRANKTAEK